MAKKLSRSFVFLLAGMWPLAVAVTSCSDDSGCGAGMCLAVSCTPGESMCADDLSAVSICGRDGASLKQRTCVLPLQCGAASGGGFDCVDPNDAGAAEAGVAARDSGPAPLVTANPIDDASATDGALEAESGNDAADARSDPTDASPDHDALDVADSADAAAVD